MVVVRGRGGGVVGAGRAGAGEHRARREDVEEGQRRSWARQRPSGRRRRRVSISLLRCALCAQDQCVRCARADRCVPRERRRGGSTLALQMLAICGTMQCHSGRAANLTSRTPRSRCAAVVCCEPAKFAHSRNASALQAATYAQDTSKRGSPGHTQASTRGFPKGRRCTSRPGDGPKAGKKPFVLSDPSRLGNAMDLALARRDGTRAATVSGPANSNHKTTS